MVALFLSLCVVGILLAIIFYDRIELLSIVGLALAVIFGFIFIISGVICGVGLSDSYVAERKIAVYEQENAKIEEQLSVIVQKYMEHEKETLIEFSPDSAITLVSLYPELKSDTLVQKQIDVYVNNNEQIKELKSDATMKSIYKWWLYFGG